jgi:hypothetical protein
MSVKFEKETVKTTEAVADAAAGLAEKAGGKGGEDLLKEVGEAITKGGGVNGYLAVSPQLAKNRDGLY